MQNDAAGPLRMLDTHTDTTDGKKAEEALQKSEERFRLVIEASACGNWIWLLRRLFESLLFILEREK